MKANADQDIIDIDAAASILKVSTKTIRRHLTSLPHLRIGRTILFSRTVLLDRVQNRKAGDENKRSTSMTDARIAW